MNMKRTAVALAAAFAMTSFAVYAVALAVEGKVLTVEGKVVDGDAVIQEVDTVQVVVNDTANQGVQTFGVTPNDMFARGVQTAKIIEDDAVIRDAQTIRIVEDDIELVIRGDADQIITTNDSQEIEIILKKGASVKEILIEGEETQIEVEKGAYVERVILNGKECEVEGKGRVDTIEANGCEAEINVTGAKVFVGEDADEVEAGDIELKSGDSVVITSSGVKPYVDFERYNNMTAEEQEVFFNSFSDVDSFFDWYDEAQSEYKALHPAIIIGN